MPTFDRYIVLSETGGSREPDTRPQVVYRGPVGRTSVLASKPSDNRLKPCKELKLEVASLSPKEAQDARRDEKTRAVARQFPLKLIKPLAKRVRIGGGQEKMAWGLKAVGADRSGYKGEGSVVAVLDTGIDKNHIAFEGVDLLEKDFTGEGDGDSDGHGTHCAGTIFGRSVRGTRIGVAPGVKKALIGKVIGAGGGDSFMLFKAIQWAIDAGCDVISMSLGFDFPGYVNHLVKNEKWPVDLATSDALVSYRDNLRVFDNIAERVRLMAPFNTGTVIVAAAGNESRGSENPNYRVAASLPAAANGVFSVGALQKVGTKYAVATFSNSLPRITAPGVGILSAQSGTRDGLAEMDGTSMACPHAAGVAALWWQSLREAGNGATQASLVEAQLLAQARTGVFTKETRPIDRGNGQVFAPQ